MEQGHGPEPILSEFAGDPEMKELLEVFVSDLPAKLDAIERAWRAADMDSIRRITHQLKGASGGYGFGPVGSAAARLEATLSSQTSDLESAQQELLSLLEICRRVQA